MKRTRIIFLTVCVIVMVLCAVAALRASDNSGYRENHLGVVLRSIGHRILLSSGDTKSIVQPVFQESDGAYIIEFQSSFSFSPDTLVRIVRNEFVKGAMHSPYIVKVLDCSTQSIVYTFEIFKQNEGIIPCLGRVQEKGCYRIRILITEQTSWYYYPFAAAGLFMLGFVGNTVLRNKKASIMPVVSIGGTIGKYVFDREKRTLRDAVETIDLSEKEGALLALFADSRNQLITRDQLLKRIWEDEGVFTGRSLDMFVSKLRKKLKGDPSVELVNVHGRGYKLSW